MTKVFIDGSAGTTGLRIVDRLSAREDLELIILPDELRKDTSARADALSTADIAFLCLPDDAAKESAALAKGMKVKIIIVMIMRIRICVIFTGYQALYKVLYLH